MQVYSRFMSPDWLKATVAPSHDAVKSVNNGRVLQIENDSTKPWGKLLEIGLKKDLFAEQGLAYDDVFADADAVTISVEIAFEYRREDEKEQPPMCTLYVVLTDDYRFSNAVGVGFKIEGDLEKYAADNGGPYCGIDCDLGGKTSIKNVGENGNYDPSTSKRFPQVFNMLFKVGEQWGSCYSALDGGHLHATAFGKGLHPTERNGLSLGLYSDEASDDDVYYINYIKISIYTED